MIVVLLTFCSCITRTTTIEEGLVNQKKNKITKTQETRPIWDFGKFGND
jgi:hypothetical protein